MSAARPHLGVDFVQSDAAQVYAPAVLARYDVLGFDPRGVARSDPATCFATQAEAAASPLLQGFYPLSGPEEAPFILDSLRFASQCQATSRAGSRADRRRIR